MTESDDAAEWKPQTLGEIFGLDKEDSPQGEIFRIYLRLDIRTDAELRKLPRCDRYVWLVYRLDQEVQNGGIDQFLSNSSGDYAIETLEALEAAGALQTYQCLKRACDLFPNQRPSDDQATRQLQRRQICAAFGNPRSVYLDDLIEWTWDSDLFQLVLDHRNREGSAADPS